LQFLENSNGKSQHKNSGIYQQNPTSKNFSCEYIFCEGKQKAGLFVYHLEGLRAPLVVHVPQFENHWSRLWRKVYGTNSPNDLKRFKGKGQGTKRKLF